MSEKAHIPYFNMGPWPFYVGFTMSAKAFRKEMARFQIKPAPALVYNDHSDAMAHLLTAPDGTLTAIIALRKRKGRSIEQLVGLIVHEATHVVQALWERIGEDQPGKEAEAYVMQMIVQCCMEQALDTGRTRRSVP